jgi:hypothetical protein
MTIRDRYGLRFLYKPVMTHYDRFFVVFFFFQFWSSYLTISFYGGPVRSPVHPKKAKKPDRTGPQSTSNNHHAMPQHDIAPPTAASHCSQGGLWVLTAQCQHGGCHTMQPNTTTTTITTQHNDRVPTSRRTLVLLSQLTYL